MGCQSPTARATSLATELSSAVRASICSSSAKMIDLDEERVSTGGLGGRVVQIQDGAYLAIVAANQRCSGWCSIMWAVMPRRLRAMRMESHRKGESCRMISTMVWGRLPSVVGQLGVVDPDIGLCAGALVEAHSTG